MVQRLHVRYKVTMHEDVFPLDGSFDEQATPLRQDFFKRNTSENTRRRIQMVRRHGVSEGDDA